jgi:hypothetical protein
LISIEENNRNEACSNLEKKLAVFQLNAAIKIAQLFDECHRRYL